MIASLAFSSGPPSDADLRARRSLLLARAEQLRGRIRHVHATFRAQGDEPPRDYKDAAVVEESNDVMRAIEEAALRELGLIGHAIERIEHGTFGLCELCGAQIDAKRLEAVPYATECRACAERTEQH